MSAHPLSFRFRPRTDAHISNPINHLDAFWDVFGSGFLGSQAGPVRKAFNRKGRKEKPRRTRRCTEKPRFARRNFNRREREAARCKEEGSRAWERMPLEVAGGLKRTWGPSTSFGWRLTPLSMTVRCDDNLAQGDCCLAQRDCCGDALGQAAKAVCCRYFSVPTCLREKPLRSFAPLDKRGRLSPRGLWSGWAFVAGVFAGVGEAGIHQGSF